MLPDHINAILRRELGSWGAAIGRLGASRNREAIQAQLDTWGSKCDARRVRDRACHVPHQFAVVEDGECGGDGAADVSGLDTRATNKERKYRENGKRYSLREDLAHRTSLRRDQGRYLNNRRGTAWNVRKPRRATRTCQAGTSKGLRPSALPKVTFRRARR